MSPRSSRRALIDPGWPRERSRRASSQVGRVDPLAPPPRRQPPTPRSRRALRTSSAAGAACPGSGRGLWLGLLAFLGAGGLVVLAAELTLRLLSR